MVPEELGKEVVDDLIRSCWIVESARVSLFETWMADPAHDDSISFEEDRSYAEDRAKLVLRALESRGRKPDTDLVEPHADWMRSVAGSTSDEVPLGAFLVDRLAAWCDNHLPTFLGDDGRRFLEIGEVARKGLKFPSSMPLPPGFDPVETVAVEPPGPVRFRFGILADLHFGSARGQANARAAVADLNRAGVDLVIQLGDLADHGNPDEFKLAVETLAELEMPFTTMMGNHDVFSYATEELAGRSLYTSSFGREPDGAIVEHKDMRFLVLDSVEHAASPFPAFDFASGSFLDGPGGAIVRGAFSPPQHDLLADIAGPDNGPAFVFLHHPPQPFTAFPPVLFGLNDRDSGRLHATVDSGNVWGVFAGHTHRNAITRVYDKVPAVEVAMPRDYPFGYGLVDVTDEGYAYRFVQISDEELLRQAYKSAGVLWRRYALGPRNARGFSWTPATGCVTP